MAMLQYSMYGIAGAAEGRNEGMAAVRLMDGLDSSRNIRLCLSSQLLWLPRRRGPISVSYDVRVLLPWPGLVACLLLVHWGRCARNAMYCGGGGGVLAT